MNEEEEKIFPSYRWLDDASIGEAEFKCSRCGATLNFKTMGTENKYVCPACGAGYKLVQPPVYIIRAEDA